MILNEYEYKLIIKHTLLKMSCYCLLGAIQVSRNADGGGGGGVNFSGKKSYGGAMFNVISVTRGWVGGPISRKKHYLTLKWPLI